MSGNPATISDVRVISIAHAIEQFFGTLRLAPRTQKAYRIGLRHFTNFVAREAEVEVTALPVGTLTIDHVTDFLTTIMPEDIRAPEDVSRMRRSHARGSRSSQSGHRFHPAPGPSG